MDAEKHFPAAELDLDQQIDADQQTDHDGGFDGVPADQTPQSCRRRFSLQRFKCPLSDRHNPVPKAIHSVHVGFWSNGSDSQNLTPISNKTTMNNCRLPPSIIAGLWFRISGERKV